MNSQQKLRSLRKFCKELSAEFPEAKITEHKGSRRKPAHAGVQLDQFQIVVEPCSQVLGVFCEIFAFPVYDKIGNNRVAVTVAQLKDVLKKYL